jgi:hypothetical protein
MRSYENPKLRFATASTVFYRYRIPGYQFLRVQVQEQVNNEPEHLTQRAEIFDQTSAVVDTFGDPR